MKTLDDFDRKYLDDKSRSFSIPYHLKAFYIGENPDFTYGKQYEIDTYYMEEVTNYAPLHKPRYYTFFVENDKNIDTKVFGTDFCFKEDFVIFDRDRKINKLIYEDNRI